MFNVSVAEAAEQLGVGKARVHQLIKSNAIAAEKVGGIWLIDPMSIQARLESKPRAGRPTKHSSDFEEYLLMNREHEVLSFKYSAATDAFFDVGDVIDAPRAPLSVISPRGKKASKDALKYWWNHRSIPHTRNGIEEKLRELGLAQAYDIPFKSMGLSLSDQYWIKPAGSAIQWKDVNYFDNEFVKTIDKGWLSDVGLDSPDNTSEGMLSKRWITAKGQRRLLKGGTLLNQEPYNEAIATKLHSLILNEKDYVPYQLEERSGEVASSCPNFLKSDEEFIPAYYIKGILPIKEGESEYRHYVDCAKELGVADVELALGKMIVCDYLLANTDRHWRNFGLIRNVETLEYSVAPLFDSGTSLWCDIPTRDLAYAGFERTSKPFHEATKRQLRLVDDISWLNLGKLDGFAEWAADFLSENPAMAGRTGFIFEGIQKHIDFVRMMFF